MGDFNVALNIEDYSSGTSKLNYTITDFKDCVYNIEVMDINSSGLNFTWNQKPKGGSGLLKKLDRIMGNTEFIDAFPGAQFKELVSSVWNVNVDGHMMYQVVSKLKALKKPFRKVLHDQEEEAVYVQAFSKAKLDEERFLKQKAKIEWLEVGDSNSAYFHKSVKSRIHSGRINVIMNSDNIEGQGSNVADAFVSHYQMFLGSDMVCDNLNMDGLFLKKVSADSFSNMVRPVTDEEIKAAVFSIRDEHAPGPDGFSSAFFKKGWDLVSLDVCHAIGDFFVNGRLLKEINHTFIALIPKVSTPLKINDYRPISCCNVIYKCISTIITNRIIDGIKEVVSDNQSAFVPGRRISDNILITQELMHNYHRNRGPPRFLIRGFLWCNEEYKRGKAKVAWYDICLPKCEGGLGLRTPNLDENIVDCIRWRDINGVFSEFSVRRLAGKAFRGLVCPYSSKVWKLVRHLADMELVPPILYDIVDHLQPMANKRMARSIFEEQVERGIIELYFVRTEYQLADMFTKALSQDRFEYLVKGLGIRCLTPTELEVLIATRTSKKGKFIFKGKTTIGHNSSSLLIASTIIHSESASRHNALADFKSEVDLGKSDPNNSVSKYKEKTKSASKGLETILTKPDIGKGTCYIEKEIEYAEEEFNTSPDLSSYDDTKKEIKLEDLSKLFPNLDVDFMDLDSLEDDQSIIVKNEEEEESQKYKLEKQKLKVEVEVAILSAQPSFLNVEQLTELLTLQWELLAKFLSLPGQVSSIQTKIKTLDALPSLLSKKNIKPATITQLFKQRTKKDAEKANLNQQPKPTPLKTRIIPPIITSTKTQFQSSFLSSSLNSSPQPKKELLSKDKGKKAMSSKDAKKEGAESESDDANLTGSMIKSSK
ncbi:aspartic peptidase [Tanacetum coccineum]